MKRLIIIPARGGSKGLPGKNIKLLNGKPLLHYSIELARIFAADEDICLSTDDQSIIQCAEDAGLKVPFVRPAELADDTASMNDVVLHALNFYESQGRKYDQLLLLQPTSPLRKKLHVEEALALFTDGIDMVVSVCVSKANPYYNLFEEGNDGWLKVCKGDGNITSRQEAPEVYMYNGAIYIVSVNSFLKEHSFSLLKRKRKYIMDERYSVDIDDLNDWRKAEQQLKEEMK